MSNERQRLEQEALQHLNRGSSEGALKAYLSILRLDPKDRRVRQKVGEIYLKNGKHQDAERHLREVAESLLKESSHRAAVSVIKQLVALRPDDPQLQIDLGECYLAGAYNSDARACFDGALRAWMGLGKPLLAALPARRLADITPAELPLRLRVGELLEAGGDFAGAGATYKEVMEEYRRRGRVDEVGRVAEMALKHMPDDVGLLLDACESRIAQGEHKLALQGLQKAFMAGPKEPRTLLLLSRAFEGSGQADRALKVSLELARVCSDRMDHEGEANALRRAALLSPDDADVRSRLAAVDDRLGRLERKLTALAFLAPTDDATLRVLTRAEVLLRYGFVDRADAEVTAGLAAANGSLPLIAAMAEVLVGAGKINEALVCMERLVPHAGEEASAVLDRMSLLRGLDPASAGPAENVVKDHDVDDDEVDDDPDTDQGRDVVDESSLEAQGDRRFAAGDLPGALLAWREALSEDPLSESVLGKIASLRTATRAAERSPPAMPTFSAPDEGTFAEIEPDELYEDGEAPSDALTEARALAAVGEGEAALKLVRGLPGLGARVVEAQARRALNDVSGALDVLRSATDDAAETDADYPEALFELCGLYTATQKHRPALRLLEELRDLAPDFRTSEVEARRRGLQLLTR